MSVLLNPYLSFRDSAREAMTFYRSVLGGELTVSTYAEFNASEDPSEQDKVMHSMLQTPDGLTLMAADTPNSMEYDGQSGVSVSIGGDDAERMRRVWDELSEGGTIVMPFGPPPWGGMFGMLTDRFGTHWMVSSSE